MIHAIYHSSRGSNYWKLVCAYTDEMPEEIVDQVRAAIVTSEDDETYERSFGCPQDVRTFLPKK